jgi:hypothetical protein
MWTSVKALARSAPVEMTEQLIHCLDRRVVQVRPTDHVHFAHESPGRAVEQGLATRFLSLTFAHSVLS